jgi:hypothetical protein
MKSFLRKNLDCFTIRPATDFPVQQLSQVKWNIWHENLITLLEVFAIASIERKTPSHKTI